MNDVCSPIMQMHLGSSLTRFGLQWLFVIAFAALLVAQIEPKRWVLPDGLFWTPEQEAMYEQWVADFERSGQDYTGLPRLENWGSRMPGPPTLEASVAMAELIVVGRVGGVEFAGAPIGTGFGTLIVEETLKGDYPGPAFVFGLHFAPTPNIQTNVPETPAGDKTATSWSSAPNTFTGRPQYWYEAGDAALTTSSYQPVVKPGDRVVLLAHRLEHQGTLFYYPVPEAGLYRVAEGRIEASPFLEFSEVVNGAPLDAFLQRLRHLVATR
jgi:hypothetical protein